MRCDVLVVGAGPAGAAAALALARRGFDVCMIDRTERSVRTVGEALHGVARACLSELGVAESFTELGFPRSYLVQSAWGSERLRETPSLFSRHGAGSHLDRARFDPWLAARAEAVGARVLRPVRLRSVERDTKRSCFRVELAHGPHRRVLEARVVLDATGRSATLSRRLGASRAALDRMVGVVRWVRRPSPPTLLVEAAEHGFWYSAPAGNGETIFLWMTGARDPSARAADPELWRRCMAASRHTLERFGVGEAMPDACVLPAGPALTTFDPRAGFLPIGDAMVSFDPISGAGLCFALRSALEAVWVVEEMVAGRTSAVRAYAAGARDVLKEHLVERARAYARERRFSGSRFWSAARGAERFLHDAS